MHFEPTPHERRVTARGPLTGRGRLAGARGYAVALLFVLPLLLIALKSWDAPAGHALSRIVSLDDVHGRAASHVGSILLVPLTAVIVVFFRTTLGIRVLGPFRSFLLAVAFQATGIPLGLFFLALVLSVGVLIRKPLRRIRLGNYARVSVVMSTVALVITLALMVSRWLDVAELGRVAYFPVIALCLMTDAFAATLSREGWRSAVWRGGMTAFVAILITELARMPGLAVMLVRFPELLVLEIGVIIVLAEFFRHRLLKHLNPAPVRRRRKRGGRKSRPVPAPPASLDGILVTSLTEGNRES